MIGAYQFAIRCFAGQLLAALTLCATVSADQILTERENYTAIDVIILDDGAVKFRGAEGGIRSVWVDEARMIILDRGSAFEEFNQAEQFAAHGEYDRAISRYKRALLTSPTEWQDLVAARTARACDLAGQSDNAVQYWLVTLRGATGGPAAAARIMPRSFPDSFNGRVERSLRFLDAALAAAPAEHQRGLIELLRFDVLQRIADPRAIDAAAVAAAVNIPASAGFDSVYALKAAAMEMQLKREVPTQFADQLSDALLHCPSALMPRFLMLEGDRQTRHARSTDDLFRATWPYLRVVIHFPQDALVPTALISAAELLERADMAEQAIKLLDECINHLALSEPQRKRALEQRARLLERVSKSEPLP